MAQQHLLEKYSGFKVRVGYCKFGRGVFATDNFAPGALIEVCPMLVVPEYDADIAWMADQTILTRYYFNIDDISGLALGYGSLYNHSKNPNAHYTFNPRENVIIIVARRRIKKDAQIFIDYGYDPSKEHK